MSHREALLNLAVMACAVTFAAFWLAQDATPEPLQIIAKAPEPCIQITELRPRKAYAPADIARLCERQQFDERFHGHPKPIKPTQE